MLALICELLTKRKIHNVNHFIGGSRGACPVHIPPPWDPILSFSHTFSPKSAHVGGPRPPPYGKSWIRHCIWMNPGLVNHFRVGSGKNRSTDAGWSCFSLFGKGGHATAWLFLKLRPTPARSKRSTSKNAKNEKYLISSLKNGGKWDS